MKTGAYSKAPVFARGASLPDLMMDSLTVKYVPLFAHPLRSFSSAPLGRSSAIDKEKISRLVLAIQNGDNCLEELWNECQAFIASEAELFTHFLAKRSMRTQEDLILWYYHPDGARFMSVLESELAKQWIHVVSQ